MKEVWTKALKISAEWLRTNDKRTKLQGAGDLIRKLSEAENKINSLSDTRFVYKHVSVPREDIATIVFKYGNHDIYEDVYQFIKL